MSRRIPRWYHNLKGSAQVELQDGAARRDCTARELPECVLIYRTPELKFPRD